MVLSDQQYRAIGRISVMFSDVETWTSCFIWHLIGPEQLVGQMVTAGMSFNRQVDLLTSLFRFRFPEESLRAELETHTKRLSELEQHRNSIMHSTWLRESLDPNQATRFKITTNRKKGLAQRKEVYTTTELDDLADDLHVVIGDLSDFMIRVLSGPQHTAESAESDAADGTSGS
jgi:hypothetical protein